MIRLRDYVGWTVTVRRNNVLIAPGIYYCIGLTPALVDGIMLRAPRFRDETEDPGRVYWIDPNVDGDVMRLRQGDYAPKYMDNYGVPTWR